MAIYIAGLVLKWILKEGGLPVMAERVDKKAGLLYKVVDESNGFYQPLVDKTSRSRVNVVFKINPDSLQDKFVKEATARGLHGLAGHRSLGGIRASVYNALSVEHVETLAAFLKEFQEKNSK